MINLDLSVKEALQLQRTLTYYIREDSLEFPSQRVKNLREIIWKVDAVIEEDRQSKLNELNKILDEKNKELEEGKIKQEEFQEFANKLFLEKLGEHDEIINP
jgi:predicted P-loop ATPase/GTPase